MSNDDKSNSLVNNSKNPGTVSSSSRSVSLSENSAGDTSPAHTVNGSNNKMEKKNNSSKENENVHNTNGDTNATNASDTKNSEATTEKSSASSNPPPPLLKGTLSYNLENKRHVLSGMWNYDYSNTDPNQSQNRLPSQRWELIRNFPAGTDEKIVKVLPANGEFHGSFSLSYFHITNKGKKREKSRVIPESGVKIQFTPVLSEGEKQPPDSKDSSDDGPPSLLTEGPVTENGKVYDEYQVYSRGNNQFGKFEMTGFAKRSNHETDSHKTIFHVELRKKYITVPSTANAGSEWSSSSPGGSTKKSSKKKRKSGALSPAMVSDNGGKGSSSSHPSAPLPLPDPSPTYPSNVVCLQGQISRETQDEYGAPQVLHRISGMWSSGLDLLLADPKNEKKLCNQFDYEHRSSNTPKSSAEMKDTTPLSGRYTGWFYLSNEDGSRTRVSEKDVQLKFKRNNKGYWNVEGRGSNGFGRYNISGTCSDTGKITIFRHFKANKSRKNLSPVAPPVDTKGQEKEPDPSTRVTKKQKVETPSTEPEGPVLTLGEVVIPGLEEHKKEHPAEEFVPTPISNPEVGTYAAISWGVLKVNMDGTHTCGGKWALNREQYGNGVTSNFHFGLEANHAVAATSRGLSQDSDEEGEVSEEQPKKPRKFPVDSAHYKGSFKMRRGANKYTSVIDRQIVLRFIKNSEGSFNVHGRGVNNMGVFLIEGKLIPQGETTGQVELYRMYQVEPPKVSTAPSVSTPISAPSTSKVVAVPHTGGKVLDKSGALATSINGVPKTPTVTQTPPIKPSPATPASGIEDGEIVSPPASASAPSISSVSSPQPTLARTASNRPVKLPVRLEDSDPVARRARIMDKCMQVLRYLREKDLASGSFFAEPVDPVALGIPTYHTVISNPMDLGTITTKMQNNEIETHHEFGRLVRLVFENAITFNIDGTHAVHINAKNLLTIFNRKYADVERAVAAMNTDASKRQTKAQKKEEEKREREVAREAKRKAKEERIEKKKKLRAEKEKKKKMKKEDGHATPVAMEATAATSGVLPGIAGYVAKSELDKMQAQMNKMQEMLNEFQKQFQALSQAASAGVGSDAVVAAAPPAVDPPSQAVAVVAQPEAVVAVAVPTTEMAEAEAVAVPIKSTPEKPKQEERKTAKKNSKKRKKSLAKKEEAAPTPESPAPTEEEEDEQPLSHHEQELLTDTINQISSDKLYGIIEIIRESTKLGDEDEIDLEIDQLDTRTQRKLQRYVKKHCKPKRTKKQKKNTKKTQKKEEPKKEEVKKPESPSPTPEPEPKSKPTKSSKKTKKGGSFIPDFDNSTDDSDSDSDSSDGEITEEPRKHLGGKTFDLPSQDDDEEDMDNKDWDFGDDKEDDGKEDNEDDDKDLWGAARIEAEASKEREKEKKAREDKALQEAELERQRRQADAEATADMIREEKKKKEEEERLAAEEKEMEEERVKEEARERMRKERAETKQEVDLDEQRRMMARYENDFMEHDVGGASPSSDFGF
eukprot:CAMPEP_0195540294 /NCGR_PEP_ID=MMETSP0794_2-20130614/50499_1 /TAXON_ID=515487 /ORGANISM="Stephanopyxis turris, Strain CCMP 815" /LENGTH=1491 /DNA_ID=CAMNT_0040674361 /DNA_START=638 /DNA_END=5113 /DNA_ORIENTATION=-